MHLDGTVTLITGASSGIGAAAADAMAAAGSTPVLVGRDTDRLNAAAGRTGGHAIHADLATDDGPAGAVARALDVAGRVDVLVNNAGIGWAGPLADMTGDQTARLIALNLVAPLQLTRLLVPGMAERGRGHIVNVTSIAGATGVADEAVYSATKAGLTTFADAVRLDLSGSGVGVSVVVPGVVDTPFFTARGQPYRRRWPRPVPPQRVADAIVTAVRQERAEIFVPRWMRLPARLHGGLPAAYRALASRFG